MQTENLKSSLQKVLDNLPADWLGLTTHRLDIYNEKLAKNEFLNHFEHLLNQPDWNVAGLKDLPTAYDYIRLGHPLSCVLEWAVAKLNNLDTHSIISFSSQTIAVLAVLRKNLLDQKMTRINYAGALPAGWDSEVLRKVHGYKFELKKVADMSAVEAFDGTNIYLSSGVNMGQADCPDRIDFLIQIYPALGSILLANGIEAEKYIADIQHVRRRETVAMTPADALTALQSLIGTAKVKNKNNTYGNNKISVKEKIKEITGTTLSPVVGSSGLSVQYAIMMGLVDAAIEAHGNKPIKFIVPPNCYGGTNDQARRVAACSDQVEVVDLPVDGDNDMVQSVERVLEKIAREDAIPYIIAEIPTNPRVEVPDLDQLEAALSKVRKTKNNKNAVDPVFILDQTFCPNVHFLGEGKILSKVRTISYASGSKFPSGGKCTAGYCVGNNKTQTLMEKIAVHLTLCDNEATYLQYEILAAQMPSMNQRIREAYQNTRAFVAYMQETLPAAKINFVSDVLAAEGFTPSVFSLDLPARGDTAEEKEAHKRTLNHQLIKLMITRIPGEAKHCVSYGQLKGSYWTIPATSTQGTTKEGDKDYIVRASLSPDMDLELHKKVFLEFVEGIKKTKAA